MSIDRARVGKAFHRQAGEYDRHTSVQKRVVDRLVNLTREHLDGAPSEILDVGCGTGRLLAALQKQYPDARVFGLDLAYNMARHARERLAGDALLVNGDADHLPFRKGAFDLVLSSSTLQWLDHLDRFFHQGRLVLKDSGLLCVAFFGGQTLRELRECYRDAVGVVSEAYTDRLHHFKSFDEVESILKRAEFGGVQMFSEIEMDYYPDLAALLRSIKSIGAGASAQGKTAGGLGWRGILNETSRLYRQRYGSDGMIPVTYEVFYIVASGGVAG